MPHIRAQRSHCQARLATPVTDLRSDSQSGVDIYKRFVAIDLGERQLGYAVFDVRESLSKAGEATTTQAQGGSYWPLLNPVMNPDTHQPAKGAIRIAGVRRLIDAVKGHRGGQASNSKLRQNFDTRLEQLRESVSSEIVQKIEALCARYEAFPVLESAVVNFQTGSRQLDLVYGDVVRLFAYSGVDAHTNRRKEHWMGADRWEHPYLMRQPYDETLRKRHGKAKPFSLFPGATVAPAGTSQTCVCCGRNPFAALRRLAEEADTETAKYAVAVGGYLKLDDGMVELYVGSKYTDDQRKHAAKQKVNLPMNIPLAPREYAMAELARYFKMSARQKNPNQRAQDTTQSWYHCLYVDCSLNGKRTSYHADAGAAVNIGRKFFATEVDLTSSLSALQEWELAKRSRA